MATNDTSKRLGEALLALHQVNSLIEVARKAIESGASSNHMLSQLVALQEPLQRATDLLDRAFVTVGDNAIGVEKHSVVRPLGWSGPDSNCDISSHLSRITGLARLTMDAEAGVGADGVEASSAMSLICEEVERVSSILENGDVRYGLAAGGAA